MPDPFFASSKSKKRKRRDSEPGLSKPSKSKRSGASQSNGITKKKSKTVDEELDSDHTDLENVDDMDLRVPSGDEVMTSGDEIENETPAEKRLRLAQVYLNSVKESLAEEEGDYDAAEIDREIISSRLKQDVLEGKGEVCVWIADELDLSSPPLTIFPRGHQHSVNSAVASSSTSPPLLFTAGKGGHIIKWDLSTGKKLATLRKQRSPSALMTSKSKGKRRAKRSNDVEGHTSEVYALALSDDGTLLASGGKDRRLGVWDTAKAQWIKGFASGGLGHRDSISSLKFRHNSHTLFTASNDRTIKLFDLSPSVMGYVETLFGHQDAVTVVDALARETCVSAGARDKTVRFWKVVDETQLVFRGGGRSKVREILEGGGLADEDDEKEEKHEKRYVEGSIESVAMIDETTFASGGDSGSICLWTTSKKKPVFTYPLAHGVEEGKQRSPRWITSLACLRYSDLLASGSWDGSVRLWKISPSLKSFTLLGTIPVPGVINSLQLLKINAEYEWMKSPSQRSSVKGASGCVLVVAGVGQEHRFGRWIKVKDGARNGCLVAAFRTKSKQ